MSDKSNGVDLGVLSTMLMQVLETAQATRLDISILDRRISHLEGEVAILRGEVSNLRGEVLDLRGEVSTLRSDVRDYHGAVMGHGILLTELDERMSRVEIHLNRPREPH